MFAHYEDWRVSIEQGAKGYSLPAVWKYCHTPSLETSATSPPFVALRTAQSRQPTWCEVGYAMTIPLRTLVIDRAATSLPGRTHA